MLIETIKDIWQGDLAIRVAKRPRDSNPGGAPNLVEGEMDIPGIEEKVAFLSRPDVYQDRTRSVVTRETHLSWVFLTDAQAWKLKKPVRYEYFDFTTPEARRRNCEEELRLNRFLAPGVYLGVTSLTLDAPGELRLAGNGIPIDWLVRMRRLPGARMLDIAIAERTVNESEIRKVGELLARFYKNSPPVAISPAGYRNHLCTLVLVNRQELAKPEYGLPTESLESVFRTQLRLLREEPGLFDDRVRAGRIIEAHGDLRPEHICLGSEPVIIDRLEFNRSFRVLDAASDLSLLALECERSGAPWINEIILDTYREITGDQPPERLLAFYKSYHACLRARIAVCRLKDHGITDWTKWTGRARRYLQLVT